MKERKNKKEHSGERMQGDEMTKEKLAELLKQYAEKKTRSMNARDKKTVRRFFAELAEKVCEKNFSEIGDRAAAAALGETAEDLIDRARKSKTEKARMYNEFVKVLTESPSYLGCMLPLEPIRVPLTAQERRLDIIKNYGNCRKKENRITNLAKKYGVSEKIISADLRMIESGELNVFGQEFDLDALAETGKNEIKSTVIPIVLASNTEEIIALLEGLYQMCNSPFKEYAEHMAIAVWMQLSDAVKDKILHSKLDMQLTKFWYPYLDNKAKDEIRRFKPEREFTDLKSRILMYGKAGETCDIQWCREGVLQQLRNVRITSLHAGKNEIGLEDGKNICISEIYDIRKR